MVKINYELLFELAKKEKIPIKKVDNNEEAGIFISNGNGGKREFSVDDLFIDVESKDNLEIYFNNIIRFSSKKIYKSIIKAIITVDKNENLYFNSSIKTYNSKKFEYNQTEYSTLEKSDNLEAFFKNDIHKNNEYMREYNYKLDICDFDTDYSTNYIEKSNNLNYLYY